MRWKSSTFPTDWVVVLAILLVALRPMGHRMVGKACFTNAMGLGAGAPVGFAGVDRGSVKSVRARPEVKNSPVEVVMVFNPRYELKIPNDATVLLETAGILGETFVDIDAAKDTGPPIGANAVRKAHSTANHGIVHRKAERSWGGTAIVITRRTPLALMLRRNPLPRIHNAPHAGNLLSASFARRNHGRSRRRW